MTISPSGSTQIVRSDPISSDEDTSAVALWVPVRSSQRTIASETAEPVRCGVETTRACTGTLVACSTWMRAASSA
ncbi:hypothetical protein IU434_25210 [Nocardia farcinica]|nr:hypothetical protein [Nocardia farcinica]